MKITVLEITDKNAYLIREKSFNHYSKLFLNGESLNEGLQREDFIISKSDTLEFKPNPEIIEYIKDEKIMSIEEHKAKPKYYDEDSSEDDIIQAIANRKELEGFEPVYSDPKLKKVEFDIIGFINETGSKFISCQINSIYSKDQVLYTVSGREAALDEYNILSEKYAKHASFEVRDRDYLRFVKINNNYAFSERKPFGDRGYRASFSLLAQAKEEEEDIRQSVRGVVKNIVFKENLSPYKITQIIERLDFIKELKTKKAIIESIDYIVKDIKQYFDN